MSGELYLRSHPELTALLTDFTYAVLQSRPEDVTDFAARFFTQNANAPQPTQQQTATAAPQAAPQPVAAEPEVEVQSTQVSEEPQQSL